MKIGTQKISTHFYDLILLLAAWAVVNFAIYKSIGVRIVVDSARYLNYASEIFERGIFFQEHNFWYLSYALYLSFIKLLHLGVNGAIAGQVLLSGVAVICIYQTGVLLYTRVAGLWASFSFIAFAYISQWNFYILCESLLISFTAISFYLIIRFHKINKGALLTVFIILFTMFIKPTGVWLTFAGIAFMLSKYSRPVFLSTNGVKIVLALLGLICLLLINAMLNTFQLIDTYSTGDLVFLASKIEVASQLSVSPPGDLFIPKQEHAILIQLVEFIFFNPIFFTKLFFGKLLLFVVHMKPYYSWLHNGWIALTLYPSYYLSSVGLQVIKDKPIAIFTFSFVALHAITVGSTTEDWDGRFLMPLLPVIFVIAGCGAANYLNKFTLKRNGDS